MTLKLLLTIFAAIGFSPAVLWALLSLITTAVFLFDRPVSLSFRLCFSAGPTSAFHFHELPVSASICILVGATLLTVGIAFIPRGKLVT